MDPSDDPDTAERPPAPDELARDAQALLESNDTGRFIKPSRSQYPHQWNWDAAFIAIGLRHVDRARARYEVRSLLAGQWDDGMVPHILYPDGASDYFPDPGFWRTEARSGRPGFPTSGLTQPPLLATAVRILHQDAPDRREGDAFAAEVYPALLRWQRWLHAARDPGGTGLLAIVHPWESGTDNAPRFAPALAALGDVDPPAYQRRDQAHVHGSERPVATEYDLFMHLIGLYRDWGWDADTLYARAPFLVQDVLFNALAHRAERDLRALAETLGEPTGELDAWLHAGRDAFETRLWDEASGRYLSFDLRAGAPLHENDCTTFAPLFAGVASPARGRRLVEAHLENPRTYAPSEDSRYRVPTVAKTSPRFEPRRYWCGPIWINVNWLLWRGLDAYGFEELADQVRRDSLALVSRSGFVEYYDPRDGSPCGSRGFSWSAALTLDMLAARRPGTAQGGSAETDER